ncbi:hypothetical protein [Acholeplasma oculi]|nr:hypothetical protein [Acholeplasma oculi]
MLVLTNALNRPAELFTLTNYIRRYLGTSLDYSHNKHIGSIH